MTAALGTTVLYIGSFVEALDITMAVIASLLTVVMVIEYGKGAPWSVFCVTAFLSLILLPNKFPALLYALFFGYYPIIKENIERIRLRFLKWTIKLSVFAAATVLLLILTKLFTGELDVPKGSLLIVIFVILSAVTLVLYDIVLTRIISYYIIRLRHRFKKIF